MRLPDGAVAQLGERRNGIAKVRGSIPLGSTISPSIGPFALARDASWGAPGLDRRRVIPVSNLAETERNFFP